jgi:hypothetical protein
MMEMVYTVSLMLMKNNIFIQIVNLIINTKFSLILINLTLKELLNLELLLLRIGLLFQMIY